MKRFIQSALFFFFIIGFCACSNTPHSMIKRDKRPQVLCTIGMISDLVREIGGDKVCVKTLIKEDLDPHSYEMVKGDDEKLQRANLIFYNGLSLEHSPGVRLHLNKHPNSFALGDYIQKEHPKLILTTNGEVDPHIWMDVSIWSKSIPLIVSKLSEVSPENNSFFEEKANLLEQKMKNVHQQIFNLIQSIPENKRYLITCHDAFYYFARSYLSSETEKKSEMWRMRFIAPEGLAPDAQLSTNDIQKVVQFMQKHQVKKVFPEYNVNLDSLHKIKEVSDKSGHPVNISSKALYGDTLSKNESKNDTYLDMLLYNAQVIYQNLMEDSKDDT